MRKWQHCLLSSVVLLCAFADGMALAEEIERTISHEDKHFKIPNAGMAVGRDGRVYVFCGDEAVSCLPDGSDRRSAFLCNGSGQPITGMAALPDGSIASSIAHFTKSLIVWDSDLHTKRGVDKDFLTNDTVGFDSPSGVVTGSDNCFYALDRTRNQIARISRTAHREGVITLAPPPKWFGGVQFQVAVPADRIYVWVWSGMLYAYDLKGKLCWQSKRGVGPICAEDDGTVHALSGKSHDVLRFDRDGKPLEKVALDAELSNYATTSLGLLGDRYVLRGKQDRELFRTYNRTTGKLMNAVPAKVETLQLKLDRRIWAPGEQIPVAWTWSGAQGAAPDLGLWIRPLGLVEFRELPVKDGAIAAPADLTGICQLRLGAGRDGSNGEPRLDTLVEVRSPGAVRGISVWTTNNRVDFAAGDNVPLHVRVRSAKAENIPATVELVLESVSGGEAPWRQSVALKDGTGSCEIPGATTSNLAPGLWRVAAASKDTAVAPQWLRIGRGGPIPVATPVVQYGDYQTSIANADFYTVPENMDAQVNRLRDLGVNLLVDRLGVRRIQFGSTVGKAFSGITDMPWLENDPLSPVPEKCFVEDVICRTVAACGAAGIECRGILLRMDAQLPLDGPGNDPRKPDAMAADLLNFSRCLADYRAFTGWSWAANWWNYRTSGGKLDSLCKDDAERTAWTQAKQAADTDGTWNPVLDTVGERWMSVPVDAHNFLSKALKAEFPHLKSSITGPFRTPGIHPPVSFGDADDIDLQYQCEQIQPPLTMGFDVDYYRRPGHRTWGHPELKNDSGTGGMVLPQLLLMAMRAPDGTGWCDDATSLNGRGFLLDPRWSGMGRESVHRAVAELLHAYLPWWKALSADDPVAVLVSRRMVEISTTAHGLMGSAYFNRIWAADAVFMAAGRPITVIFPEELQAGGLKRFKAVVVLGQTVPPEPAFAKAMADATASGIPIYSDATCRPGLVEGTHPLGVDIDSIKPTDQDDSAWSTVYDQISAAARELAGTELGKRIPAIFTSEANGLFASQRLAGQGRFIWVTNQARLPGAADHWWRCTLNIAETQSITARVMLPESKGVIYDVFAQKRLAADAPLTAEYGDLPARIYAVLPEAIHDLKLTTVAKDGGMAWTVQFAGPDTLIPVRIRLMDPNGSVLAQEFHAAPRQGLTGTFLAVPAGAHVEAVELLGGETAAPNQTAAPSPVMTIGPRLGDLAVSADGREILVTARRVGANCAALDAENGTIRWQTQVGDHHALAPVAVAGGFAVTGVDLSTAEVCHSFRINAEGQAQRRIAGFGLPLQSTNWAFPANLENMPARFAASSKEDWTVTGGDLGVACIDGQGRVRWKREPKPGLAPAVPWAATAQGAIVVEQDTLLMQSATDGHAVWSAVPMPDVPLKGAVSTADGRMVVVWSDEAGGLVAVVRDGKPAGQWPLHVEYADLAADGSVAVLTDGPRLTLLDLNTGPRWNRFEGDSYLRPHFAPDGAHIAVGNEKGMLYVLDRAGKQTFAGDLKSAATVAWLPGGDLIWATWLGEVGRMSVNGAVAWRHPLTFAPAGKLTPTATDRTPWSNALPEALPLTPNLLDAKHWVISLTHVPPAHDEKGFANPENMMMDGKSDPPEKPWIDLTTLSCAENGWTKLLAMEFDAWRRNIQLDAITIVEDPSHPDSWLRSVKLQWWNDAEQTWSDGPVLRSDQAIHSHRFDTPLVSRSFRLISPGGSGRWPAVSPRFAEIVFHGKDLGPSHPDVAAGNPVAVLFDEHDGDLPKIAPNGPVLGYDSPYSGTRYVHFEKSGARRPQARTPVGATLPNWDFPIAEKPQPGEYRWLQFAWRTPESTTSVTVTLGASITAGEKAVAGGVHAAATPPRTWTLVRVDLWTAMGKKPGKRIQTLNVESIGGGVDLDQIILARDSSDLDAITASHVEPRH